RRYLVKFYYYLSICFDSLKLVTQKNEAIDSCIAYEMNSDTMYHFSVFLLSNSVRDLYFRGDYNLCVEHASLGESLTRKSYHYSDRMDYILSFTGYKANALWSLKKYDEAEQFLQDKKEEFLKSGNKAYLADIYRLFAYVYRARGENQAAIDYFLKAYTYDRHTETKTIMGEALTQVGLIYSEKFNLPRMAMQYYHKALRTGNKFDAFYIYGHIANAYTKLKKFDSAYYFFQKAFNIVKPGFTEQDLITHTGDYIDINSTEHVLNIVLDKADAFLEQYGYDKQLNSLHEALRIYRIADRLLNQIKEIQFAQESRLYWRSYAKRLYEHAIESSFLTGNMAEAFYFFEKSRAVLLNDQMNEQNLLSREDLLMSAHLKSKILITGRALRKAEPSSEQYADIQNELFTYKQELFRFQERIKKQNPVYYQSSLDTSLISIQEVQKKLLNGQGSFVDLFSGDSAIYTLVIAATEIHLLKSGRHAFDSVRNLFNSLIDKPDLLNRQFSLFENVSASLFKMIFQNISLPPGRIIISPDGQYFPFEALITGKTGETVNYFLYDHAVSYTYSARFLFNDFYANSSAPGNIFMGIAPVSYPSAFSLASLAGSEHSLATIAGHFSHAVNMTSLAATRNNFLQQFYKYRIIQLYTHASGNSSNNEPVIYFADSALYLSELIGESKPLTRLVVLSGCETGSGKEYKGEGVFSFNRGFAALGIPSSVTNLWAVDNEATYKITELFYKYVADGLSLDEALQKAKKEFIKTSSKEKQLPYYWAAAVLVGSTDSIPIMKSRNWPNFMAAAGIPVLLFILFSIIMKWRPTIPTPRIMGTAA
ncbi:MAG: hypothetical protein JWM28_4407, partial [Chitinophagaceae bacterium]|nr:hypothetical protein [Chitinophagaceae bacterium]